MASSNVKTGCRRAKARPRARARSSDSKRRHGLIRSIYRGKDKSGARRPICLSLDCAMVAVLSIPLYPSTSGRWPMVAGGEMSNKIEVIIGDITEQHVDAIVNAANES